MLGKILRTRHFEIFFFPYFFQKTGFHISCDLLIVSLREIFQEVSIPVFWENKRKYCHFFFFFFFLFLWILYLLILLREWVVKVEQARIAKIFQCIGWSGVSLFIWCSEDTFFCGMKSYEPECEKTYLQTCAFIEDSDQPCIRSLCCPHGETDSQHVQNAPSKDSDQTAHLRSLIWIFAGCTCLKVRLLMLQLVCLRLRPLRSRRTD